MLDFDLDLGVTTKPKVVVESVAPEVVEQVRVVPVRAAAHQAIPEDEWNWSDLRDYILEQVEQRHGPQVRDPRKESGIIKSFITRWEIGPAIAIARAAFEVHDGMWRGAPISINRFCKASDPYFAAVIAANIA